MVESPGVMGLDPGSVAEEVTKVRLRKSGSNGLLRGIQHKS